MDALAIILFLAMVGCTAYATAESGLAFARSVEKGITLKQRISDLHLGGQQ